MLATAQMRRAVCQRQLSLLLLHHVLNDLIARGFASPVSPSTKIHGSVSIRREAPDGLTLVPWQSDRAVCWDVIVTCICPLAESYFSRALQPPLRPVSGTARRFLPARKRNMLTLNVDTFSN